MSCTSNIPDCGENQVNIGNYCYSSDKNKNSSFTDFTLDKSLSYSVGTSFSDKSLPECAYESLKDDSSSGFVYITDISNPSCNVVIPKPNSTNLNSLMLQNSSIPKKNCVFRKDVKSKNGFNINRDTVSISVNLNAPKTSTSVSRIEGKYVGTDCRQMVDQTSSITDPVILQDMGAYCGKNSNVDVCASFCDSYPSYCPTYTPKMLIISLIIFLLITLVFIFVYIRKKNKIILWIGIGLSLLSLGVFIYNTVSYVRSKGQRSGSQKDYEGISFTPFTASCPVDTPCSAIKTCSGIKDSSCGWCVSPDSSDPETSTGGGHAETSKDKCSVNEIWVDDPSLCPINGCYSQNGTIFCGGLDDKGQNKGCCIFGDMLKDPNNVELCIRKSYSKQNLPVDPTKPYNGLPLSPCCKCKGGYFRDGDRNICTECTKKPTTGGGVDRKLVGWSSLEEVLDCPDTCDSDGNHYAKCASGDHNFKYFASNFERLECIKKRQDPTHYSYFYDKGHCNSDCCGIPGSGKKGENGCGSDECACCTTSCSDGPNGVNPNCGKFKCGSEKCPTLDNIDGVSKACMRGNDACTDEKCTIDQKSVSCTDGNIQDYIHKTLIPQVPGCKLT
jgi:hypothetical protein